MESLALYIHIPFCKSKCYYCDFNSYPNIDYLMEEYVDALIGEFQLYKEKIKNIKISTIFIGGGTPTYLSDKMLYKIMESIYKTFELEDNAEISIEANPDTINYKKLTALKKLAINRLSIGLQTWDDHLLKKIGRRHTVNEFLTAYKQARKVGFDNINIDLIYALPGQTREGWIETLNKTIKLEAEHISSYGLILEEGTKMHNDYINNKINLIDDEQDRQMYHYAVNTLIKKGYDHYEISNFAKKGFECKHNLIYWQANQYIGIGAGSHSYIGELRYSNLSSPIAYIDRIKKLKFATSEENFINKEDKMSIYIFMNLRLIKGLNIKKFNKIFKLNFNEIFSEKIDKLIKKGLLVQEADNYRLTPLGLDLSNQVFLEFI